MRGRVSPRLNFLDRAIGYVSPLRGVRRTMARQALDLAAQYRSAENSRLRSDWIIVRDETTPDPWELINLRERSRDLNRNDPVAAGATDTLGLNIVGRGLRPQSRLRADYLGLGEDQARQLQRQAESIWQNWTATADAANRLDFDELQYLALRKIIEDGEVLALPVMVTDEPWRQMQRAVELLEADRLTAPLTGGTPTEQGTGIVVGERGQPLTYYISRKNSPKTQAIDARDDKGRPRILHLFRTQRPGQLRGIPFFAPVISYFKDLADYLEAELVAARVAACLAVFVTKEDPAWAAQAMGTTTETGTGARLQQVEPGLVNYLALGEKIQVVDPKRGGETFNGFVEGVLRLIGASLGLPYELLLKDFSKTNYSSARAALLEGRRVFTSWRHWFAAKFCQPFYDLVLEEAYLRGLFTAPNFYKFRQEYTRAQWIGGAWGWVDPVKEVQASKLAIDYGLSTLAEEVAGQGRDWEENLEQLRRERDRIGELDLPIPVSGPPKGSYQDVQTEER
jgi:lambda family phage portal protein